MFVCVINKGFRVGFGGGSYGVCYCGVERDLLGSRIFKEFKSLL